MLARLPPANTTRATTTVYTEATTTAAMAFNQCPQWSQQVTVG